ncbi:MAG: DUF4012 domain-containing protein [Actinobacteria bacterium]|nr:DUF4012 domain-containing protein [Actinomycetota bacterium]
MTAADRGDRRRWPLLVVLVLLVLVVWGAAVATAALSARSSMRVAEDDLHVAREAVGALDIEGADAALADASSALEDAQRRLGRPDVRLATRLPLVGDDLRTATAVADGAALVAAGGRTVTAAILALPDGADSLLPRDGALPAVALAELVAPIETASAHIVAARDLVVASPEGQLVAEVADARADFLELVEPVAGTLDDLTALAGSLPPFLGAEEPRRYFLAAANPAEQRGTIGFLGSYAIATFDEGRLSIGSFGDINDLDDVPLEELDTTPLPPRYDAFGGSGTWKNLNLTPDFPSAAEAIEALWERTGHDPVDGTIVVDPFALAALVELSGPVELPDGTALIGGDVVAYVTNEAYADLGSGDERKGLLGEVAGAALLGFLDAASGDTARESLGTLSELVADGHLLVHSRHPDVQQGLAAVGADGALPDPEGDFLAVVVNSATNAKVDYYTGRSIAYRVQLLGDGAARSELEVTFDNDAPAEGRPQHVLGPNVAGLDVGDNRFVLSTYCATSCELEEADDGLYGTVLEDELGHPVATTWVEVPRGGSRSLRYAWRVADAWEDTEGRLVYRLTVRHQVTVPPTDVRLTVTVPEGFVADEVPEGMELAGDELTYEDRVHGGETVLEVRLRPVG